MLHGVLLTVRSVRPQCDRRGAGEAGQPDEERPGADEGGHDLVLREAGESPRPEPGAIQGGAGAHGSCFVLKMWKVRGCSRLILF